MNLFRYISDKWLTTIVLTGTFLSFLILSWWLLFRDERALTAFEFFYPHLDGNFMGMRTVLLRYGLNVLPTLAFALTVLTAFGAYFLAITQNFSRRNSIILALVFQAIIFFSYPILSTDIFSYIFSDRVYTEYKQNVWQTSPDNFPSDPFEKLADWKDQSSVYGLVNHWLYLPAAILGDDDLFKTVLLYKLVPTIFSLLSLMVVLRLVGNKPEQIRARVVRTIFWNPLFVLEMIGSGHNDILMIFFLLLSLWCWQNKKWLGAGLMLALSVQVKIIPVLVFFFFCLKLLQTKNLTALTKYAGVFITINLIAFWLMVVNPLDFLDRVAHNNTVYWQSLPSLLERFVPSFNLPFSLVFLLIILALSYLQIRKKWTPIQTSAMALMAYIMFFTTAYWNWYVFWPFILVVFTQEKLLKKNLALMTMTSMLAYPLLWLSHRYGFGNPIWPIVTYLIVFAVPLGLTFLQTPKKWLKSPLLG
jgi:hypothetical protein